jgi:O-antigen ligase/tetratricopeptide (TPR) repeat protein
MLNKILTAMLPVTLLIIIVQTVSPSGILSFLNPLSMVITSLCVYSIGWVVSSFLYNKNVSNYSLVRHIGIAAIFALPIVAVLFVPSFLYPYIVGKAFTFRFLIIIAFCSLVYLSFTDENYRPKVTPFLVGSTVFAFVMALATLFSIDTSRSFWSNFERMEGYINLISLFILALTSTSLRLKDLEWGRIFTVHLWVSSIVSTLAVLQYLFMLLGVKAVSSLPILGLCFAQGEGCRVDSTLGNSIYLGIYSALTFWLIIFAIFGRKVKGNLLPFLAAVNLLAVYFSGTRGVWVGMLAGLIVLMITKYWFDGNKKAVAGTILSGALFVLLFAGFIFYAKANNIAQDVPIVARFSSMNTLFARWSIWKTAIISWEQKPVFGWGQENFIHAFNLNYNPAMYGQETYFDHPHNTYLGWLVFGGILGFLGFLYMLFMSVFGIVKSNYSAEKENDLIIPILLALITTYVVHIFFVFDNLTSSLLFVLISVYFGSQYSYGVLNLKPVSQNTKNIVGGVVILLGLYMVYTIVYKPSYANLTVIDAMTYQQHAGTNDPVAILQGTQTLYEKAINMDTLGTYEIREFYLQKSLEFLNLLPQVTDERVKSAIVTLGNSALNQFKVQVNKNPFDHRARFMLGLYYLNIKNYDLAVQTLEEAVQLAPNKQIALIYLAKAYLLKGDLAKASTYYERAISVTPRNIAGYNQIRIEYIQILMLANQDEKALQVIKDLMPTVTRDDFNSLVSQMTQVYSQRKDMKSLIKLLNDANNLDPQNQNFVLWLAQAYVAAGQYNDATFTVNKLGTSNPAVVAQFNQQLQDYIQKQQAQNPQATPTSTSTQKTPVKAR